MCPAHKIAGALVWIGAINWGLVGFFQYNLVHALLGGYASAERVVYVVVGVAALFMVLSCWCKGCKKCADGSCKMDGAKKM